MPRSRALVGAALAVAVAAAGCGKKGRARRSGDAGPAVVVVDRGQGGQEVVAEKEPNQEQPQPIALGGGVKGRIDAAADVDVYELTVAEPGRLRLHLTGVDDADLVLELRDLAGTKLIASDNGPAKTVEGIPNWSVVPGKYRVAVSEFVKKQPKPAKKKAGKKVPDAGAVGRAEPSGHYTLTASLDPLPGEDEEKEPNDTAAFAGAVRLPGSGRGFAGWRKDKDVWRVPLDGASEDEGLSVDVDGVAGVALRVAVLDGTEKLLLERQGRAGDAVSLRNVAVRPGEPHYFIVVTAGKGNPEEGYELRVTAAPLELDEEAEPNDDPKSAGPIADIPGAGGLRVGYLPSGDVDLYLLDPADEPRVLAVTVEPPGGADAVLSVVDAAGAVLAGPADEGGKGKPEHVENVPVPAGQTVYVRVAAKAGNDGAERYRLRWSAAPVDELETAPIPGIDE